MNELTVPNFALPAVFQTGASLLDALSLGDESAPRISLKGSMFRFIEKGKEVGVHPSRELEVVIVGSTANVGRVFYKQAYDPSGKAAPDCYSKDGKTPAADAKEKQSAKCAGCPQDTKGSGKSIGGKQTKACAYKKRIVVAPTDLSKVYALDVSAQSLFDDGNPAQNQFGLKGYIEYLRQGRPGLPNGVDPRIIKTKVSFDTNSSVPKLFFGIAGPNAWLTQEQMLKAHEVSQSEEVQNIIDEGVATNPGFDEMQAAQVSAPVAPQVPQGFTAPPVQQAPQAPVAAKPIDVAAIKAKLENFDD